MNVDMKLLSTLTEIEEYLKQEALSDLSNIEDFLDDNPDRRAVLDWLEDHDVNSDADFLEKYTDLVKELHLKIIASEMGTIVPIIPTHETQSD